MPATYQEINNLANNIRDLASEQGFTESMIVLGDPSTGNVMIITFGGSAIIRHMDAACHAIRDLHGGIQTLSSDPFNSAVNQSIPFNTMALPIDTAQRIADVIKEIDPTANVKVVEEERHVVATTEKLKLNGPKLVKLGVAVSSFNCTIKRTGAKVNITIW